MGSKNVTQMKGEINSAFPDNDSGLITAQIQRSALNQLIDEIFTDVGLRGGDADFNGHDLLDVSQLNIGTNVGRIKKSGSSMVFCTFPADVETDWLTLDDAGVLNGEEDSAVNFDKEAVNATGTGGTSTATIDKMSGVITSGSITTAAGDSHVMTVTCDKSKTGRILLLTYAGGTNTKPNIGLKGVIGSGSFVVTIYNFNADPLDGTVKFNFLLV